MSDEVDLEAAAEAAQQAAAVEWGTYTATQPIYIDGVRAFNPGAAVPVSHVSGGIVDAGQVTDAPISEVSQEQPATAVPEESPVPAAVEEN
jgi:hypothetical protein